MMVLLWGGGHVCVSLSSDAWYKRSEEENAGGIWNDHVCVWWAGEIMFVCVCMPHFVDIFSVCVFSLYAYSLRLITVSGFSSSLSQLRSCFLLNLLSSICLYL